MDSVSDSSFEQQFQKREIMDFTPGKIMVSEAVPDVSQNQVPVFIAPGWSENPDTYRKAAEIVYGSGRRVIAAGYSLNGGAKGKNEYPEAELAKAELMLNMLDKKGIEKVDVIAHSEGAMNTLVAAMLHPEKFRNIVLDKPAGLIGKDTGVALMGRFVKLMLQEAAARPVLLSDPNSSLIAAARVAKYITENPKRTIDEMDALTKFDITELLTKLKDKGIMVSVIAGVDDPLFPVKRQVEHLRQSKSQIPIEGYYSVVGGHNELSLNAGKHTSLAINALDGLQYKRTSS